MASSNSQVTPDDENDEEKPVPCKPLKALIMTPTRELALQIKDHLVSVTKYTPIKVSYLTTVSFVESYLYCTTFKALYLKSKMNVNFLGCCSCWWNGSTKATKNP